jgi:hypothetical protein
MNDVSRDKTQFREGFVDTATEPKSTLATPAPQIESSPAEVGPLDVWPIVVKLQKPISGPTGETITQLAFREPRGGDINRYGNPVRMNAVGDWVIEERKMHFIMAGLSGVLAPFLDQMDTRDWNICAYELMRFFLPNRAA